MGSLKNNAHSSFIICVVKWKCELSDFKTISIIHMVRSDKWLETDRALNRFIMLHYQILIEYKVYRYFA